MNFLVYPLTLVTFFPLLGILVLLFLKPEQKTTARWVALITSLITFAISVGVLVQFDPANPDLQMVVNLPWIQVAGWNISYFLGVDGLSILLLLLTTFLTPIFNPKTEIGNGQMSQDIGAQTHWENRSHTRSGLARFSQCVCAQEVAADGHSLFRFSG